MTRISQFMSYGKLVAFVVDFVPKLYAGCPSAKSSSGYIHYFATTGEFWVNDDVEAGDAAGRITTDIYILSSRWHRRLQVYAFWHSAFAG